MMSPSSHYQQRSDFGFRPTLLTPSSCNDPTNNQFLPCRMQAPSRPLTAPSKAINDQLMDHVEFLQHALPALPLQPQAPSSTTTTTDSMDRAFEAALKIMQQEKRKDQILKKQQQRKLKRALPLSVSLLPNAASTTSSLSSGFRHTLRASLLLDSNNTTTSRKLSRRSTTAKKLLASSRSVPVLTKSYSSLGHRTPLPSFRESESTCSLARCA